MGTKLCFTEGGIRLTFEYIRPPSPDQVQADLPHLLAVVRNHSPGTSPAVQSEFDEQLASHVRSLPGPTTLAEIQELFNLHDISRVSLGRWLHRLGFTSRIVRRNGVTVRVYGL